jgi:hypothetical protein
VVVGTISVVNSDDVVLDLVVGRLCVVTHLDHFVYFHPGQLITRQIAKKANVV